MLGRVEPGGAIRQLEVVGDQAEELVATVARRYGLSHAALNALAVIEGAGGPIPTGEISARMHITTGTTTSVLDTLERNGYVKRIADPSDRRRVLVDITPDAQGVLDKMLPEVQHVVAGALANIDGDALQALLDALAAVSAAIRALPDTSARRSQTNTSSPAPHLGNRYAIGLSGADRSSFSRSPRFSDPDNAFTRSVRPRVP